MSADSQREHLLRLAETARLGADRAEKRGWHTAAANLREEARKLTERAG